MTRKEFLQHYWRYYLVLEEKFKNTLNYIELDWQNAGTFSNEYALLLQSIGAELDNFFKVYCGFASGDRKNINDYCTFVLNDYSDIVNQKVLIPERDMEFQPYQGWSVANPAQSLAFWDGFCKIKHSRYANIQVANQKNVLYALGALYLLEMKYLSKIATSNEPDVPNKKSELFELDNWTYRFTPMGEMFACIDGEVCQIDDEN